MTEVKESELKQLLFPHAAFVLLFSFVAKFERSLCGCRDPIFLLYMTLVEQFQAFLDFSTFIIVPGRNREKNKHGAELFRKDGTQVARCHHCGWPSQRKGIHRSSRLLHKHPYSPWRSCLRSSQERYVR
eukprot:Lithocolla_globosa_v1_NODE_2372_length_2032_cov_3.563480.p3 type:complete len:129 gc:universal NODE_2372_length_2032_cov_3.563480:913-527(-)